MIGFNGGLIGGLAAARATSTALSQPGVWTLPEQRNAKLALQWPVPGLKLLDAYTGAAAAYSLRLLRSGYTGPLVSVRRADNNSTASFTQAQIDDGTLAAHCSGTDGLVTVWYDQSGNGNNATPPAAANQPKIFTNATGVEKLSNNKPCLTFNSTGTSTFTMGTRLTNVRSVFQVLKIASALTDASANFILSDSTNFSYHTGGQYWLDSALASGQVTGGENRINNIVANLTNGTPSTTAKTTNLTLISMVHTANTSVHQLTEDRGNSGRSIRGAMQELVLYSSSQSTNVAGINGDIMTYYAIT